MGSTTVEGVDTDEALALDSGLSHMMSTSTMNNQGKIHGTICGGFEAFDIKICHNPRLPILTI
jgi:hypothetical protein